VREIVKLAVSQAQKQSSLSEYTTFSRVTTSNSSLDPFDGDLLYTWFSIFDLSKKEMYIIMP